MRDRWTFCPKESNGTTPRGVSRSIPGVPPDPFQGESDCTPVNKANRVSGRNMREQGSFKWGIGCVYRWRKAVMRASFKYGIECGNRLRKAVMRASF